MEWIKQNYFKIATALMCAVIFAFSFLIPSVRSSAAEVNYLSETNYLINSEICNSMLLESQYGSLSTTWNPDTFLTFSNRDVLNAFGVSSGVIKQSGSSAGNRLFVYPYQGADFVFPAVDGVVDHYELIFSYLIEDCASANMARARGNSSPSVYYPFLSVDGIQLQYYTTSGTLRSIYVSGAWPEVTYTFSITRDGQTSYYTAEDTYFWDNYDFSYPVLCTLTISKDDFKKWKSDFVNFTGADIYFGGACFFYQYGFNLDDPYFTLRPTSTRLKTVYMTREDYAAIQKEEEFRDNVSSDLNNIQSSMNEGREEFDGDSSDLVGAVDNAVSNFEDAEQKWQDEVNAIYENYPDAKNVWEIGFLDADVVMNASPSFTKALFDFLTSYTVLYVFIAAGFMCCLVVFYVRR